jgi:hypothetical protein
MNKEFSIGDIRVWVENETAVHIKAVNNFGDPVELNADELKELIEKLSELLKQIE